MMVGFSILPWGRGGGALGSTRRFLQLPSLAFQSQLHKASHKTTSPQQKKLRWNLKKYTLRKGETSTNRPICWFPAVGFRGVKIPMFVATFWLEFVSLSPQNFPSIRPSNEVPKLSLSIPNLGWNGMGLRFMQYVCNIWFYTVYTIYTLYECRYMYTCMHIYI